MFSFLALSLLTFFHNPAGAQIESEQPALLPLKLSQGIRFQSQDDSFRMNLRFRMQNQLVYETQSESDASASTIQGQVRRLRMRFRGELGEPKIRYDLQLSFSRADQDFDNSGIPNVVRDAVVYYDISPQWHLAFGQTKLPGNRQRVVSSGELQLVDRSLVNRIFNIDRDIGVWFTYADFLGKMPITWRTAVSSGEGRGVTSRNGGIAYTSRFEILPLGEFSQNGDYVESDLAFEEKPKVSLGLGYSFNDLATRTGGQVGAEILQGRSFGTTFVDLLYKHRGVSLYLEYMRRELGDPIVPDRSSPSTNTFIYAGYGWMAQAGYMLNRRWEIAGRYAWAEPDSKVKSVAERQVQSTLGLNYFFNFHRVKLQSDITHSRSTLLSTAETRANWIARLQLELGI